MKKILVGSALLILCAAHIVAVSKTNRSVWSLTWPSAFAEEPRGYKTVVAVKLSSNGSSGRIEPPEAGKILVEEISPTNNKMLDVSLESQGATEMRVGEDLEKSAWVPFQGAMTYFLSKGDGPKKIFAQFRHGPVLEAPPVSVSIVLDTQPPTDVAFEIEEGEYATQRTVHLLLIASDAAFFQARHGEQTTPWMPLKTSVPFELSSREGKKVVDVRFRDQAGNESEPLSQEINLYTEVPSQLPRVRWISVSSNPPREGQPLEVRALVTSPAISTAPVAGAVCTLTSGVKVEFTMKAADGKFNSVEEQVVVTIPPEILAKGDVKEVHVKGRDIFGRWGDTASLSLNPLPLQVLEKVQQNYKRLIDLKARLETQIQLPGGEKNASTRAFFLKSPDKMKSATSDGQTITIMRGSILTIKSPDLGTSSTEMNENGQMPIAAANWFFHLRDEDDGEIKNDGFLDYHEIRFNNEVARQKSLGPNFFVVEAVPKDPSCAKYSSLLFTIDYSKGVEVEVLCKLGEEVLAKLTHEKIDWVGDVMWFGTSDLKVLPLIDVGELCTSEIYEDILVNTGISDQVFEL